MGSVSFSGRTGGSTSRTKLTALHPISMHFLPCSKVLSCCSAHCTGVHTIIKWKPAQYTIHHGEQAWF